MDSGVVVADVSEVPAATSSEVLLATRHCEHVGSRRDEASSPGEVSASARDDGGLRTLCAAQCEHDSACLAAASSLGEVSASADCGGGFR